MNAFHNIKTSFTRHKTLLLSLGFLVLFSVTVSYATPPAQPFTPGQTLDPSCAPREANCTVTIQSLLKGAIGGQTVIGGTQAGNNLTLTSTSDATKGKIVFGTSAYDEANNRLGIGTTSPSVALAVTGDATLTGALSANTVATNRVSVGTSSDTLTLTVTPGSSLWNTTDGNQGITNDGTYYYVTESYAIFKRRMSDNAIVASKVNPCYGHKVGGVLYVPEEDVLYTVGGTYEAPFETHFCKIDKNTLDDISQVDLTPYTTYGINAVVRVGNHIYVGETSAATSNATKRWLEFDLNLNFIQVAFSDVSNNGENDYQAAVLVDGKVYSTDHAGFLHVFAVNPNGTFTRVAKYYSGQSLLEGITQLSPTNFVMYWRSISQVINVQIVENATAASSVPLSVIGSGFATDALAQFKDSGNATKFTLLNNGNVGIGTSTPAAPLHIASPTANLRLEATQSNQIQAIQFTHLGSATWQIGDRPADNNALYFSPGVNSTSGSDMAAAAVFTIKQNGNIGIGTVTPTYKQDLFVASPGNEVIGLRLQNSATGTSTGTGIGIGFTLSTSDTLTGKIVNYNNGSSDRGLAFSTFNGTSLSEALRITGGGNVGIGTTSTNPSGFGTVSLTIGKTTTDARTQVDLIGNRTAADAVEAQIAGYHGTGRIGAIGFYQGTNVTSGYIQFGTAVSGTLSSKMTLSQAGNLGIGTTTPTSLLDVGSGTYNVTTGATAKLYDTSPNIVFQRGTATTSGDWNIIDTGGDLQFMSGYDVGSPSAWRAALITLGSGSTGGSTAYALGISQTNPLYLLHVGSSTATGIVARFQNTTGTCDINPTATALSCSSDMNLKKNIDNLRDNSDWLFNNNIQTADDMSILAKVLALNPVNYNWNTEENTDAKHTGFIAQEVKEVFPDLVTQDKDTQLLSLNYMGLIPYTIEAIKEINLNVIDVSDLSRPNNWRDSLLAWFGNVNNGITAFFSRKVTTNQLCVKDNDGETCLNRTQVNQLMQQQGTQTIVITPSVTPPETVPPADTQSPETTPLTVSEEGSQAPETAPTDEVQAPETTTDVSQ